MVSIKILALTAVISTTTTALSLPLVGAFDTIKGQSLFNLPGNDNKPIPGDSPMSVCDASEPQLLELKSLTISPNPPLRGENMTISAVAYLSKDIAEGAYVEVDVFYGYIKLLHQTYDLCEQIGEVDMECPLKAGEYTIIKQVAIPDQVPPGKYVVNARAFTEEDDYITCLSATVVFPVALL
ncbi:hypothetical protein BABINDRAFT_161463 [Babjeviella inositovora NRRL Y-12698]|uniref:Phosphatidylglycerol/phosphatidylinositol transfer protein n=1 Tax=Babjeviella inositovora NRRL Y-12698 TaxID=984486 RepID=A0A1E3QPY8_9ASCO|nr:uncharacterized protein BABINDRAFT_161463 [Babjeviella inositovora NRRL Y-12698]ODQ79763.1 hypothetical protein BABINDRAFT_161463 [Babjeviella inositovora NRRL Y-12698]